VVNPVNPADSLTARTPNPAIQALARARLLAILPELDGTQNAAVLHYLEDGHLIFDKAGKRTPADLPSLLWSKPQEHAATVVLDFLVKHHLISEQEATKELYAVSTLQETQLSIYYNSPLRVYGANFKNIAAPFNTLENGLLDRVNFENAKLQGANLQYAVLCQSDFRGAHLENAKLKGAILYGAKLAGAHLNGGPHWRVFTLGRPRSEEYERQDDCHSR
jgi:hypothetical protein